MLWHADNNGHTDLLYSCLVDHYAQFTRCIYKFDHYLEMMLFHRIAEEEEENSKCQGGEDSGGKPVVSEKEKDSEEASDDSLYCYYLQSVAPGRIVDYVTLLEKASSWEDIDCNTAAGTTRGEPHYETSIDGASIICFPLQPKPHQVAHEWIQRHWQNGS